MFRPSARSAVAAGRRFVSTAASGATKYTTLSNGVTVATEVNPFATSSAVGFFVNGGSRSEYSLSNGISALTTNILADYKAPGVFVSADNTKESNGLVAHVTNDNIEGAAKAISEIVNDAASVIEKADFAAARKQLYAAAEAVEADPAAKILEHLNASAFQGYSLGLPTLGTEESIPGLEVSDSLRFTDKAFVSGNAVISASGNFDHDKLVDAIEKNLKIKTGSKLAAAPATFLGSEVRLRDDTLPKAYVSIAVQGEGLNSPAYYVAKVAAAVVGNYNEESAFAKFTAPKLASIVPEYHIVDKYHHFSNSYSDTGLWGFTSEMLNVFLIDDFTHFALKEWNRLSISVTDGEVARAKAQAKTEIVRALQLPSAIATDVGRKVLLGYRPSAREALQKIDAITTGDVKAWAQATLWDQDIVISGTGKIEGLFDYMRNRNDMAMMRW